MWNLVIGMSSALTRPEPARWARALHISVSHNPVMEALTLSKVQREIFQKVEIFRGTQPSAEIFREGLCTGLEFRFRKKKIQSSLSDIEILIG